MSKCQLQNNSAFVINHIFQKLGNRPPNKKTVQKMIYLIKETGIDLGYDYYLYFYGPYSADLDEEIISLTLNGAIDLKYTYNGHLLTPLISDVSLMDGIDAEAVEKVIDHYVEDGWNARKL